MRTDIHIPFELRHDHVVIEATVSGHTGRFIVDTGSGLSSLDAALAARLGITPDDAPPLQAHGTGAVATSLATVPSLSLGDLNLRDHQVMLLPLAALSEQLGYTLDGIFGFDILSRSIILIDFATRTLSLLESYDGGGIVVPVDLTYRIPIAHAVIEPTPGQRIDARLAIDLGSANYALRLLGPFVDAHAEALASTPAVEGTFGTGVGGTIDGRVTQFHSVRLGDLEIPRPTVGITNDRRGALGLGIFDGTIGAPVLGRTRLVIDYARQRIVLDPTEAFEAPYVYDVATQDDRNAIAS
jgi:hypothetical protein